MEKYPSPHLIHFPKLGNSGEGYISVGDNTRTLLPFEVQRMFWTYYTPESIVRGRHAHHRTQQVLIAAAGRIIVTVEVAGSPIQSFRLEEPNVGLYIPPNAWHTMQYSHSSVQLVLASTLYEEVDYIRDYDTFRSIWGSHA